ncbi:hypothetical protein [uncultured Sulfitobacter sp.]|uniref:hypothetical protein n=1 Tax=uncultured Sulfitobacter sp. TaxID=191468 RepID=UPI00260696D4|nr:hypothetical protein [uncultured Sulfitobacter sp.]
MDSVSGEVLREWDGAYIANQYPEFPRPETPEHLPNDVAAALLDAERCFAEGLFNPAATFYGKAIERAIKPLLGDNPPKMLGPMLGRLEESGLLPDPMIDWIRLIKESRNLATHDDADFQCRGDVEPARDFTLMLLRYLFTMPEEVRIARQGLGS